MKVCIRCVMDETDSEIQFDEKGICNYCNYFDNSLKPYWYPGSDESLGKLEQITSNIKNKQKYKKYDAIIGLSGGIDSSYLAYWAVKKAGLRLLAVHVDAGWNSELAVHNIESIVKKLGIDLHTEVINWKVMRELQVAFLKSGVANQDTPQDHAFFGALYHFAMKNKIKYILSGSNYATELVLPRSWGYCAMDADQVRDINKKFGSSSLKDFPMISFFKYNFYYPYVKKMQIIAPLNYINYIKNTAKEILQKELDWKDYGGKHYESRFTKFFQSYWLPKRFGYDKRKAHFSSLILSNQMSRQQAKEELEKPAYDELHMKHELEFIAKKLGMTSQDLTTILNQPLRSFRDYKNHTTKMKVFNYVRALAYKIRQLPSFIISRFIHITRLKSIKNKLFES